MKISKILQVGIILITGILTQAFGASVLEPGSRIVAGDLTQNEFYILAANTQPTEKPHVQTNPISKQRSVDKKLITANKIKAKDIDKVIARIKTAIKQAQHDKQRFIIKPFIPDKKFVQHKTKASARKKV